MKTKQTIMAKKGLNAKLKSDGSLIQITFVCENSFIMFKHLTKDSEGGAVGDNSLIGLNGEIIKHPKYFINNN